MQILQANEATNPGNIGAHKNTPYTGKRPIWNKDHQREIGSHDDWHDKDIYTEGLADIFDMMKDQPEEENLGVKNFEEQIKPHTTEELFKSVCYVLATHTDAREEVKTAANLFLPIRREVKVPKGLDENKFEDAKEEIEDAVIDYCTTDALDILQRIRNSYKKQPDKITPKMNFGTILAKAVTDEYDLQDKIVKAYTKWRENGGEERISNPEIDSNPKESPKGYTNTIIKELSKAFPTVAEDKLMAAVSELVTSEFGIGLIKQALNGGE